MSIFEQKSSFIHHAPGVGNMPLVTSRDILQKAYENGYAVGGFNAHNLETVRAIVGAAEEEGAPVIIQLSRSSIEYAGLELAVSLIGTAARHATVPVVLHLDHGMSLELNVQCLRAGFTSLMFDGTEILLKQYREKRGKQEVSSHILVDKVQSRKAFEANLEMTMKIVEIAHSCGVPVEAELGKIPRLEDFHAAGIQVPDTIELSHDALELTRKLYALPDMAEEFVRESRCDSLAVACGSVHGMTEAVRPLNIRHLEEIASRTGIPLVLHGSSGVIRTKREAESKGMILDRDEGGIEDAIRAGIAKINISTQLQITFLNALRRELAEHPEGTDMRRILPPVIRSLKECVISYIRLFGASGKA